MNDLRRAFDAARYASEQRGYLYGQLGKPDGTVAIAERPGWVYVRLSTEAEQSLSMARNANRVPQRPNLPVRLRREGGVLVIVDLDTSAVWEASTGGNDNPYAVTHHTHRIGTGLEYEVEGLRLEPGRVYPAGGLTITINPFRYYHAGAWQTYAGATISLGIYRPSTVGKHRWVLVCVDPDTNAQVVLTGSDENYATTLTAALLDAIDSLDYIPLAGVQLRNDDTTVESYAKYYDARGWINTGIGDYTDENAQDAIGTILAATATITPAYNDSTPSFTWNVNDDSIINAKLANMAAATIKGRAAGGGTGDPQDLSVAQIIGIIGSGDGAGSGLDADLLDGLDSTAFALVVHTHDHGAALTGLGDDDHTIYALLAGRAGSQTLNGGNAANEDLTLKGTSHATKASSYVLLQPDGGSVGIGTSAPPSLFTVSAADTPVVTVQTTDTTSTGRALVQMYRDTGVNAVGWDFGFNLDQSSGRFDIRELSAGPAVNYRLTILKTTGYVGIGTTTPQGRLQVDGTLLVNGDGGGVAGMTGITDQFNSATSSGIGTIKMCGSTARDSQGFIKCYIGTATIWIPYFTTITG